MAQFAADANAARTAACSRLAVHPDHALRLVHLASEHALDGLRALYGMPADAPATDLLEVEEAPGPLRAYVSAWVSAARTAPAEPTVADVDRLLDAAWPLVTVLSAYAKRLLPARYGPPVAEPLALAETAVEQRDDEAERRG